MERAARDRKPAYDTPIIVFERPPDRGRGLARDLPVRWPPEEVGQPWGGAAGVKPAALTELIGIEMGRSVGSSMKGLRQFLTPEQQRDWMEGKTTLIDADERSESLEQRFKYVARFEKLLRRPQAEEVLEILRTYGENCIPIPRRTERFYWSVSCLPSTSDKPLARVNASWMELFTLLPDGEDLRARFILHLSDFTTDGSSEPDHLDEGLIEQCVAQPEDVSHFLWKDDTFGLKIRGVASIRKFLAGPRALRAIRNFNLTHMNRGRNAYQASHCYSLADVILGD
jgi:hypothetical protein